MSAVVRRQPVRGQELTRPAARPAQALQVLAVRGELLHPPADGADPYAPPRIDADADRPAQAPLAPHPPAPEPARPVLVRAPGQHELAVGRELLHPAHR